MPPLSGVPRLSALMPNYNDSATIGRSLEELFRQSLRPFEVIVVDDGSTDASLGVIREAMGRHPEIRLLRNEQNQGVLFSVNRALGEARGDYVTFTGSNDHILAGFFEKAMTAAARHPQAGIVMGQMLTVDPHGCELGVVKISAWKTALFASPERFLREYLDVESPMHSLGGATVYRRDALLELGGFRFEELGHWCDTFVSRILGLKHGAVYIPENVYRFVMEFSSYSKRAMKDRDYMLGFVSQASRLMRSRELSSLFPEEHVRRWEKRAKKHALFFSHPLVLCGMRWAVETRTPVLKRSVRALEPWIRQLDRSRERKIPR